MQLRKEFRFTLPNGNGIKTSNGHKVTGIMRLTKVKDIVLIERDSKVQKNTGDFYVVLLSKVITQLGAEGTINRNTIERLNPIDFAFLVDFLHEINHQIIKRIPLHCPNCDSDYYGEFEQLGEA